MSRKVRWLEYDQGENMIRKWLGRGQKAKIIRWRQAITSWYSIALYHYQWYCHCHYHCHCNLCNCILCNVAFLDYLCLFYHCIFSTMIFLLKLHFWCNYTFFNNNKNVVLVQLSNDCNCTLIVWKPSYIEPFWDPRHSPVLKMLFGGAVYTAPPRSVR